MHGVNVFLSKETIYSKQQPLTENCAAKVREVNKNQKFSIIFFPLPLNLICFLSHSTVAG